MAKILDSTKFTTPISKLVELQDNYIINGTIYNKTSLSPSPMNFSQVSSYNNTILTNSSIHNQGASIYSNKINSAVIGDNYDANISYVVTSNLITDGAKLYKIVIDGNTNTTYEYALPTTSYTPTNNIVDQDEENLYFICNRSYSSTSGILYYFNKKTTTFSPVISFQGIFSYKIIHKDSSFIYFATNCRTDNYIYKWDKKNNILTVVYNDKLSAISYIYTSTFSDIDEKGVLYTMVDSYNQVKDTHNHSYRKYTIDFKLDSVIAEYVELDLSILENKGIPIYNGSLHYNSNLYNIKTESSEYIIDVITTLPAYKMPGNYCSIYVFKKLSDNKFKLVSRTEMNPNQPLGCLSTNNNKTLILSSINCVEFYTFNEITETFEITNTYAGNISCVGIDMNDNIFIQSKDTSVEMISPVIGIKCEAKFDKTEYNYLGIDISGNLEVAVYSFTGKYLSSTVELNLSGNVVFADGSKSKRVTTSNTNKVIVPVVIKDAGLIKITTKIL